MSGLISYLRTSTKVKSLSGLDFKAVMEKVKQEQLKLRLQIFMQFFRKEKQNDEAYLKKLNQRLLEWQLGRDREHLKPAALVYHHTKTKAKALHGFRYQLIEYQKKDRETYQAERTHFSKTARITWLKTIANSHYKELKQAGLSDSQITLMKNTGRTPLGYQVHHRLPLDNKEVNEANNLILIQDTVEYRALYGLYNPGALQIKLISEGQKASIILPIPPANAIIYPDFNSGYYNDSIPNSILAELYDVDRNFN